MIQEKTHPVLKGIRKQLTIEIAAFTIFLIVYYDFFDGDQKPWWTNVLLVIAMSFVIIHNVLGYLLTKRPVKGQNIVQSLEFQINKMKTYAVVFITTRFVATICLLIFFISVIRFNTAKFWILAGIALTLIIQLTVLAKIWLKRTRYLRKIRDSFSETSE